MPPELRGDRAGRVDALRACARERLGMEIQAITRADLLARSARAPDVWHVMTEVGTFWLVERDGVVELLLAAPLGGEARGPARYRSASRAAQRFLELHP